MGRGGLLPPSARSAPVVIYVDPQGYLGQSGIEEAYPLRAPDRRLAEEPDSYAGFVLDALEQAVHDRRPVKGAGLIHHSDRRSQYLSIRQAERLGDPCDVSQGAPHGDEPAVGKRGRNDQRGRPIGRTTGGMKTKLHAVTDANGRPMRFFMTAGQISDCRRGGRSCRACRFARCHRRAPGPHTHTRARWPSRRLRRARPGPRRLVDTAISAQHPAAAYIAP